MAAFIQDVASMPSLRPVGRIDQATRIMMNLAGAHTWQDTVEKPPNDVSDVPTMATSLHWHRHTSWGHVLGIKHATLLLLIGCVGTTGM